MVTNEKGTRGVTPAKTKAYEKHVGTIAHAARLAFDQYRLTPAQRWPWQEKAARFGISVVIHYSGQGGDCDNYFKTIADACNGVLWVDDRQVDEIRCRKVKTSKGAERAEIEVWVL